MPSDQEVRLRAAEASPPDRYTYNTGTQLKTSSCERNGDRRPRSCSLQMGTITQISAVMAVRAKHQIAVSALRRVPDRCFRELQRAV